MGGPVMQRPVALAATPLHLPIDPQWDALWKLVRMTPPGHTVTGNPRCRMYQLQQSHGHYKGYL